MLSGPNAFESFPFGQGGDGVIELIVPGLNGPHILCKPDGICSKRSEIQVTFLRAGEEDPA